ncbi:MAG TPA: FAD-dependent oxidoreductase, partial [Planctomycetota bacterium]|nr:FAD-dependent oxidoreductase [Planctomycetota bacterium]
MIRPAGERPRAFPLWRRGLAAGRFAPLDRDLETDVVILGAGITGLTTAYRLKKAGLRVAVLDPHPIATGATGHSSAHLTAMPDRSLRSLVSSHGEDVVEGALRAGQEAVDLIADTAAELGRPELVVRVPGFSVSETTEGAAGLLEDAELARKFGLEAAFTRDVPLPYAVSGALRLEEQGRLEPALYIEALAEAVDGDNGRVFVGTRAEEVQDGEPCRVSAPPFTVTAKAVVEATHTPPNLDLAIQTRLGPYTTYILALRLDAEPPDALIWDDADPYHYLRRAGDLLILGGEDHKTGQESDPEARFAALLDWARAQLPVAGIERRWSHEVFEPADGLPYIGRDPGRERVYLAAGFAGNGLTYGTIAGVIISDLLQGRDSAWAEIFSPKRVKPLASAREVLRENLNFAWHLIADRLHREEKVDGRPPLAPGEGRVMDVDGRKAALYRDPEGHLHVMSAVCRHAGCVVRWNTTAKTWDCPCHGGRYLPDGRVLCAPPTKGLRRAPNPEPGDRNPEPEARTEVRPPDSGGPGSVKKKPRAGNPPTRGHNHGVYGESSATQPCQAASSSSTSCTLPSLSST